MEKKRYSRFEALVLYEEKKMIDRIFPERKSDHEETQEDFDSIMQEVNSKKQYNTKILRKIVRLIRKKGFYIPKKEQRKIDWSAYTLNQINDIINTLHFIRDEIDNIHTPRKHNSVGRPSTDEGKLAKAILFVELFGIPERKAEGWVFLIGYHLGIEKRIDDRVIGKAYKKRGVISILYQVFENNKSCDGEMGGDGTGLEQSRKENYESTKKKGRYMTSIVDSREIVQEFDTSGTQECVIMHELVKKIAKELKKDVNKLLKKAKLTLDSGFVDKKLAQLIENSEMIPFIFPKKVNVLKSDGSPGWKRMLISLIKDVQAWLREYHVRSHTESFHSSFKRIFGMVTKRLDDTIHTQVLARIIHNNRRKTDYFNLAEV
jgi:transposase